MLETVMKTIGLTGQVQAADMHRVTRYGRDMTFIEVLKARLEQQAGVAFSAHALNRLNERGITLKQADLRRLSEAVARAEEKQAGESLILIDDKALIVSIRNRTVVTAMAGENVRNNVFTNIDSTVIA